MTQAAHRLPGISFDSATPAPEAALPRMDIGMLVGFAAAGPLHTPVAIGSPQELRDIFGPDISLAWNAARGEWQTGQLGASVESFLRNGGKRCWVVRVADESEARTAEFVVPRLVRVEEGPSLNDAMTVARSPGSWADQLQLRAILDVRQLRTISATASEPAWRVENNEWSVTVVAPPEEFEQGELISLQISDRSVSPDVHDHAFLIVDSIQPTARGTTLSGQRGYWLLDGDPAAIAAADADVRHISESAALGLEQDAITRGPDAVTSVSRLRLELQAWTSENLTHRLGNLGFAHEHPRYVGLLPTDEVLFRCLLPNTDAALPDTPLFDEIESPRFPFAVAAETAEDDYLPIAMSVQAEHAAPSFPIIDLSMTRRERDGLERFDADHFIDRDLAWFGARTLLQEAQARTFLARNPRPLRGIYNALLLDEATMISAPDALHRQWDARVPPYVTPLEAPTLLEPETLREDNWYKIEWTPSSEAQSYLVEIDSEPSFPDPRREVIAGEVLRLEGDVRELLEAPETSTVVELDGEGVYFARVRAEKFGIVSGWSNSRVVVIPPGAFFDCANPSPEALQLELNIDTSPVSPVVPSSSDATALVWRFVTGSAPDVDRFEIEEAGTLTFAGESKQLTTLDPFLVIDRPMSTARFYRVRATVGSSVGPWSNTRVLPAGLLSDVTLVPVSEYVSDDLLAVQRSIARICQARGDLFGVLSVPEHFRPTDVIDHATALTGMEPATAGFSFVQPLSVGERRALSHVGMFYPWLINRAESSGRSIVEARRLSPEGSVMGMIARRTLSFGAWIAPANEPFIDTLAVTNEAAAAAIPELSAARVNVVQQTPGAFLTLNEATLSRESEWLSIHVRRLMHLLRRLVLREGNRFVFEPNSGPFRDRVRRYFVGVLTDLFARGALAGRTTEEAFRVVIDESVNDEATIERGRLIVELHVAPSAALKFMRVRLVQTGPTQLEIQEPGQ